MPEFTFIKYILIGLVNTAVGYSLIFGFMLFKFSPEISNFFGYLFGIQVSYILNKKFNFKSNNRHSNDLPRFLISMAVAYILNLAMLVILYRLLGLNPYVSQFVSGVVYIMVGFCLSRFWVFRVKR